MAVYRFTVVIEPDEDAFHAYVPALPGCHTFGSTVEEAHCRGNSSPHWEHAGGRGANPCWRGTFVYHSVIGTGGRM